MQCLSLNAILSEALFASRRTWASRAHLGACPERATATESARLSRFLARQSFILSTVHPIVVAGGQNRQQGRIILFRKTGKPRDSELSVCPGFFRRMESVTNERWEASIAGCVPPPLNRKGRD